MVNQEALACTRLIVRRIVQCARTTAVIRAARMCSRRQPLALPGHHPNCLDRSLEEASRH